MKAILIAATLVLATACASNRPTTEQLAFLAGPETLHYCVTESEKSPDVTGAPA